MTKSGTARIPAAIILAAFGFNGIASAQRPNPMSANGRAAAGPDLP